MRTFSNTSPNAATTSQTYSLALQLSKTQFRSHLKTYLFGISYPPYHSFLLGLTTSISTLTTIKTILARRRIYQVTSVSCFYGRHTNLNFTLLTLLITTWFSRVNNSLCLPPYHLTFVLSYRRPTLVWHKSLNKQCLIKEININKHLHYKNPLISYSESDRTRCLHHAVLLLRHVEMYRKVTRPVVCTTQCRW